MVNLKPFYIVCLLLLTQITFGQQLTNAQKQQKINAITTAITLPSIPNYTVTLTKFGGIGNGTTNNKKAFDKALKKLKKNNGGTLIVPKGTYLVNGPITLISNVNLHLEEGAVIKFGSNPANYPLVLTSWEGTMLYNHSPLVYGYNLTNVAITGKGVIDGEAANTWLQWKPKEEADKLASRTMNHQSTPVEERVFGNGHYLRPQLVQLVNCTNILVQDIKMEDSPFWCLHLLKCTNVTIQGVRYNAYNKNNDGIDVEYTKNVLIENVTFNNGDDNIAIKAGRDHEGRANAATPSENIVIRNCLFKGLHALVIGSEMSAGVQNVFVSNCKAHGYLKRGIYFKTNRDRGGYIKNIYIDDIQLDKTEDCFYITANYHGEGNGYNSKISDIYINNVTCQEATGTAIIIQGYTESKVTNVVLSNITVQQANNGTSITNTENVVVNNLIIGKEATVPTSVK